MPSWTLSTLVLFVDIIQIKADLPPFYPIFDKFIFDKVLIMLTSLPPLKIFDKNHEILGFETYNLYYPYYFLRVRGTDRKTQSPFKWIFLIEGILQIPLWARLSNKSYKIECFYFWQYVLWPPPSPTFVKKLFLFNFLKWGWPPSLIIWTMSLYCFF